MCTTDASPVQADGVSASTTMKGKVVSIHASSNEISGGRQGTQPSGRLLEFRIGGMTCAHCPPAIEKALTAVVGADASESTSPSQACGTNRGIPTWSKTTRTASVSSRREPMTLSGVCPIMRVPIRLPDPAHSGSGMIGIIVVNK